MTLRPYKYAVVVIFQELDEDGSVVAERTTSEPLVAFGPQLDGAAAQQVDQAVTKLLSEAS